MSWDNENRWYARRSSYLQYTDQSKLVDSKLA